MSSRTLWEEGRQPGRLVAHAAAGVTLLVVLANLLLAHRLTLFFDVVFVLTAVTASLTVRPRDFFVIGVFPPLLMAGTVLVLAVVDPTSVADPGDGLVQAVVSGLAHHSGALVAGYGLTLLVLAIRRATLQKRRTASRARTRRTAMATPPVEHVTAAHPVDWDLPAQANRRRNA
jgi:hypothetical protein